MSDFDDRSDDLNDEYEDDFIDDDDEDDDEDYDGGRGGKSNKRKKLKDLKGKKKQKKLRMTGRDFLQIEAEEEDEEEESGDEVPEEERREAEKRRKMYENELRRKNKGPGFLDIEEEGQIEEYFESAEMREAAEGDQLTLLPTHADPKLFVVKCKPNEERDACLQIMKKYFECLGTPAEFQIFSACAVEKTQGYIYIEAFSDKHVYMAITNIPHVFGSKITLVNFADRTQIFESDPTKTVQVKIGQWVRVKRGLYEGDLAQIQDIDESKGRVEVKLVPRLLPEGEEEKDVEQDEETKAEEAKKKRYDHLKKARAAARSQIKPPQKLFQENEYQGWSKVREVGRAIHFVVYKGNKFYDGLLYKWFPLKNLITQNVNVTYEESKFFTSGDNTDPELFSTLISQVGNKPTKFFKGDRVKVIKGDLMNLEADIIKINPTSLVLRPTNAEYLEALEISPGDCVKAFPKGAYVRVVDGKNAGKEGFVLQIDDNNVASLMSDGLQNVIQVFVNDLVFCNESTRNIEISTKTREQEQDFVKFDLVKLNDRKTVGIILGTANTGWKILDNFGNVRNVTTYQIEQKLNTRNNMTKNDKSQTLRINDSVRILQGKYKGQTGIIKHIYNDLLFIYNPDVTQNMGVVIEKANNAYLLSSQRPTFGKPSGPKGRDDLIGKKCAIKSGPWKGYQGIVKDGSERTVRLELTAKCQIIDVKRELVIPLDEIGKAPETVDRGTLEPKTPMINRFPQSPMFNLNSPGFENSPAWGFESPAYDQHL